MAVRLLVLACGLACLFGLSRPACAPIHVVIVIEENHNADSIIGSPEAP